jgi:hypothetical protein
MIRQLLAAKLPNEWMVSAVQGTAFWNEITLLQQLGSVFF